jgi:hypothetical protein
MTPSRIAFLDAARGLAIALALLSHGLSTFAVWPHLGPLGNVVVRLATSSATPTFILLFGAMLELVYHRRALRDGETLIRRRLLRRSLNCYLAYLATIAASVVAGRLTLAHAAAAALFVHNTRFGNILKFYALALVLAIPLLALRRRHGITGVVAVSLGVWIAIPLLDLVAWPEPSSALSYLTATLVGRPAGRSWISVLHSQVLIGVGMLLGWSVARASVAGRWSTFRNTVAGVLGACAALVTAITARLGARAVLSSYVMMRFRSAHHPAYYLISLMEGVAVVGAMSVLLPPGRRAGRWAAPLLALGSTSLFAYTLGSCLLNLVPAQVRVSGAIGALLSVAAPALVVLVVHWRSAWATARVATIAPPAKADGRYAGAGRL